MSGSSSTIRTRGSGVGVMSHWSVAGEGLACRFGRLRLDLSACFPLNLSDGGVGQSTRGACAPRIVVSGVSQAEQAEVATGLAQAQEGGQDEHPARALVLVAAGGVELEAGLFEELAVDLGLRGGEVAEGRLLNAVGEFGGHVLFPAAQQHGAQAAGEAFAHTVGGGVAGAGEREFVAFAEVPALAEVARQGEMHDRPQVAHRVFHGRAR